MNLQKPVLIMNSSTAAKGWFAKEESKRVTSEEVREFVIEGKYPASLMMKSNAATYTCVEDHKTP